jgi:WD40 repeat protein
LPIVGAASMLAAALVAAACSRAGDRPRAARPRLTAPPAAPSLMFVSVASDDTFERVAIASLANPDSGAFVSRLSCKRVYFAADRGICLTSGGAQGPDGPVTTWSADVFDRAFTRLHRIPLDGLPSRVRVSPDGRRAAATMFVSGHSYASGFSTQTVILDLVRGEIVADLETLETWRDGAFVWAEDFNFWGVTFASDGDTFYATLDTGGISYLVKGSVDRGVMHVVHPRVECPSLSPDNRRIAFKKRIGRRERGWWQIAVLDLASMTETLVHREIRSVDDQVEWLDNERVAYYLSAEGTTPGVWAVRVDNSATPQLVLADAYSPAAIHP